jgi:hypothetical protein
LIDMISDMKIDNTAATLVDKGQLDEF